MNTQNQQSISPPVIEDKHGQLLTTEKLARYLDCAPRTLMCQRVNGGGPPFIKLGSGKKAAVRYDLTKVIAWLEEQARETTSDLGGQQ